MRRIAVILFSFVLFGCDDSGSLRQVQDDGSALLPHAAALATDQVLSQPIGTVGRGAAKTALVIGNSGYRAIPALDNPASDAQLMSRTLKTMGFQLIGGGPQIDLSRAQMASALSAYRSRLSSRGGIGVVYFAGHAVQIEGRNWLAPTDVAPSSAGDVTRQFIAAEQLFGGRIGRSTNLVILDACRDNPFSPASGSRAAPVPGLRGTSAGLSRVQAPPDTLVAFATSPGAVALDGSGSNSPYAAALARALQEPGARVEDVFIRVRNIVSRTTGGQQTPWETSSLTQRVVLRPSAGSSTPTTAQYDGTYVGALKCESVPEDPGTPSFVKPGGRSVQVRIRNGTGRVEWGRKEPEPTHSGGSSHDTMIFRVRPDGTLRVIGTYQYATSLRYPLKIGEPMTTKSYNMTGKATQFGFEVSGSRGGRTCKLSLERF